MLHEVGGNGLCEAPAWKWQRFHIGADKCRCRIIFLKTLLAHDEPAQRNIDTVDCPIATLRTNQQTSGTATQLDENVRARARCEVRDDVLRAIWGGNCRSLVAECHVAWKIVGQGVIELYDFCDGLVLPVVE